MCDIVKKNRSTHFFLRNQKHKLDNFGRYKEILVPYVVMQQVILGVRKEFVEVLKCS